MPRISSQQVRQALLEVGDPVDPSRLLEKLQLFDEFGQPIDFFKDRSRMRWAGIWRPEILYEANDVVINDDKLWVAKADVLATPFAIVGQATDYDISSGSPDTITITVPVETQVGDLLIFAGNAVGPAGFPAPKPVDGGWTTLIEHDNRNGGSFGGALCGVYAKIATAGDLGTTKGFEVGSSGNSLAQLWVIRGANLPNPAETDYAISYKDGDLPTVLVAPAGSDPADTSSADKVLRIFAGQAQNFVNASDEAQWEVDASDGYNRLLTRLPTPFLHMGSYWSHPGAVNPPDYRDPIGEHKHVIRVSIRLPSPTSWDEAKWDQIAEVTPELPVGGATGEVLTKASSADADVLWLPPSAISVPDELPVGGADGYILAKASSADGDVEWIPNTGGGGGSLPAGGSDGQVLTKQSSTDGDAAWETPSVGGGISDPSIVLDDSFATGFDTTDKWVVDAGGFTYDAANKCIVPTAANSAIRAKITDVYNAFLLVEFEVTAGFNSGAGYLSLRIRLNSARTHGWHANSNGGGNYTLYKLHTGSFTSFIAGGNFTEATALVAGRKYWLAVWAYQSYVGHKGAYFPFIPLRQPSKYESAVTSMSADSNFFPDAAGRVEVLCEQAQIKLHRVTIRDLSIDSPVI